MKLFLKSETNTFEKKLINKNKITLYTDKTHIVLIFKCINMILYYTLSLTYNMRILSSR